MQDREIRDIPLVVFVSFNDPDIELNWRYVKADIFQRPAQGPLPLASVLWDPRYNLGLQGFEQGYIAEIQNRKYDVGKPTFQNIAQFMENSTF